MEPLPWNSSEVWDKVSCVYGFSFNSRMCKTPIFFFFSSNKGIRSKILRNDLNTTRYSILHRLQLPMALVQNNLTGWVWRLGSFVYFRSKFQIFKNISVSVALPLPLLMKRIIYVLTRRNHCGATTKNIYTNSPWDIVVPRIDQKWSIIFFPLNRQILIFQI